MKSKLRTWREGHELSLQEMADLAGVSKSMLFRVEEGLREFAPMTKVAIARRLGARIADLFDVEEIVA